LEKIQLIHDTRKHVVSVRCPVQVSHRFNVGGFLKTEAIYLAKFPVSLAPPGLEVVQELPFPGLTTTVNLRDIGISLNSQIEQGSLEIEVMALLNKADDVAFLATSKAVECLSVWIHSKGRGFLFVKGTGGPPQAASLPKFKPFTLNNGHNSRLVFNHGCLLSGMPSISALMSETRQAEQRIDSFTGFGKRPSFTPFHQVDFDMG
jgi:hypothetical protein